MRASEERVDNRRYRPRSCRTLVSLEPRKRRHEQRALGRSSAEDRAKRLAGLGIRRCEPRPRRRSAWTELGL